MTWVSYAQNFEDVILHRALRHVEPVLAYARLLQEDRLDETVIQAALGERKGEVSLYEIPETGLSTLNGDIAERHMGRGFAVQNITLYLSDVHLGMRSHFNHGPCVFDDFALSDLSDTPFCWVVAGRG